MGGCLRGWNQTLQDKTLPYQSAGTTRRARIQSQHYHGDRSQPPDRTMTETTVMNMRTAAFLTNAIRAIITSITRVAPKPQATLAIPVAAPLRIRRQAQLRSGIFRSIGLIPPQ